MDKPQDISTAPRETPVLVWDGVKWRISELMWESSDWESGREGFWFWDVDGDEYITHWHPLPNVPTVDGSPPSGEVGK